MEVFLTGATGFIGQRVLRELTHNEEIDQIYVLSRKSKPNLIRNEKINVVTGDIRVSTSYERIFKESEPTLIHLAAKVGLWSRNKQEFHNINVRGTRTIIKTALENNIPKILYASSFFAIGPSEFVTSEDVNIVVRRKFLLPYEHSKYLADIYISSFVEKGAPIIKFYPTYVYGPGEKAIFGNIVKGYLSRKFLSLGHMIDRGSTVLNWVYVDDVAKAIVQLFSKGKIGKNYLISGYNHSVHTLFRYLYELTGIPPMRSISPFMAKMYGFLEEIKAKITGIPPLITRDGVRASMVDWAYGNDTMIQELGIIPISFKEGLKRTLPYYYRLLGLPVPALLSKKE